MPDLSRKNISDDTSIAMASERQVWDSLNPKQRSQVLGQDVAGEANYSTNENSVYQRNSKVSSYESMSYSSLPAYVQTEVSNRLHTLGYFQETYGGTVYEVEGDNKYDCKDCEQEFVSEEDLRVHRKVDHDNEESETESQEAYFRSLEIDPTMTKDNLKWARKILRGESSRQEFPQNKGKGPVTDPPLPKGRREYDDNPNHYFYDNKLFRRGSRGGNYDQTGTALTEARKLIQLEEAILEKYGWESTIDVEKDTVNRQVFASEVALKVNAEKLHPRTLKIIDSVNRPLLVNTLTRLGARWGIENVPFRGDAQNDGKSDIDPHQKEDERVLHQDYDPEHPHEHNDFDVTFGNKVAEEQEEDPEDPWGGKGKNLTGNYMDAKSSDAGKNDWKSSNEQEEEGIDITGIPEDDILDNYMKEKPAEEQGYDDEEEIITSGGGEDSAIREIEDNYQRAHAQMKAQKDDPSQEYGHQKGQEEDTSDYEVDVDEYLKTGEPVQKIPTDKRAEEDGADRTCPNCGFYTTDPVELHSHTQDHVQAREEEITPQEWDTANIPERKEQLDKIDDFVPQSDLDDPFTQLDPDTKEEITEDFPFEKQEEETTVTAEPDLLDNVNTDVIELDGEQYDPEEEYDQKAKEARILSDYIGNKTKGGESIDNILDGAIDVPEERETVEETIYNRKLDGYHEDKIARELAIYHDIEYDNAIESIRAIEVSPTDKTAKTLFGKKYSELNENEKSEIKILDGESRKRSTGDKNARR